MVGSVCALYTAHLDVWLVQFVLCTLHIYTYGWFSLCTLHCTFRRLVGSVCALYTAHLYIWLVQFVHCTLHIYSFGWFSLCTVHCTFIHLVGSVCAMYTAHLYMWFFSDIFFQDFNFCDISFLDFIGIAQSPYYLRGKIPGIQNPRLISNNIRSLDFFTKVVFPGFFQKLFLHDVLSPWLLFLDSLTYPVWINDEGPAYNDVEQIRNQDCIKISILFYIYIYLN